VVALGEIGLAGELRRVRDLPQRIAEASRLGFAMAVVPGTPERSPRGGLKRTEDLQVVEAPDIASALRVLRLTDREPRHLRPIDPEYGM
jgi:DNA repair protein RadA/Sms